MRRFFILALLLLLVIPAGVFAQDGKPLWDLTQEAAIDNLAFTFNYPDGWVSGTSQDVSGLKFAENQADLEAILDTDAKTSANGYSISLVSLNVTAIGLKADAPLEDVVTTLLKAGGINEEERTEIPVLTRRAISVFGTNQAGRPGIATIWLQKDTKYGLDVFVLFSVGATEANADLPYSWGQILGSVTPINALEMGDTPLDSPNGDFTMSYPKDWFTDANQPGAVAELQKDFASSASVPEGVAFVIFQSNLADLGTDVTDLESLGVYLRDSQGWDETIIPSEHVILDQPALTYAGPNPNADGSYALITAFVQNDEVVIIAGFIPSENRYTEIAPTYLAMLQSIQSKTTAS